MKMVCPHCGVNGSADDSLLERKVKCPKCSGIFKVTAEILLPIAVEEFELEQLNTPAETAAGPPTITDEVDGAFDDIFGKESPLPDDDEEEILELTADDANLIRMLNEEFPDEGEVEPVAALTGDGKSGNYLDEWADGPAAFADYSDEFKDGHGGEAGRRQANDDNTLIVIEDEADAKDPFSMEADSPAAADEDDIIRRFDDEWQSEKTEGADADRDADILDFSSDGDTTSDDEVSMAEDESAYETVDEIIEESPQEHASEGSGTVDTANMDLDGDTSVIEDSGDDDAVQKCSACGEYIDPALRHRHGGNVYCGTCVPTDSSPKKGDKPVVESAGDIAVVTSSTGKFSLGTLLKDTWWYTKGAKGSIWAALVVMSLILFGIGAAGVVATQFLMPGSDTMTPMIVDFGSQMVVSVLSYIFTAGILLMAVRKVGGKPYSWKMVFSGFRKSGTLLLAVILQTLLLIIGFCLFILPGIYLSVGYMLTFPLILERGMSPWQAMEASRMAIHKRWWTVFFSLIVMSLLCVLSAIPAGLGLIWTVPMFFILIAILYYHFFGDEQ